MIQYYKCTGIYKSHAFNLNYFAWHPWLC